MKRTALKPRPGMTLPEVITAMVLMGIIGAAVTGVFVSQSQLHDHQEKASSARNVTRGAVNLMLSDLRMLERGGALESATNAVVEFNAPVAFGIVCRHRVSLDQTLIARLPGDTLLFNEAIGTANSYIGHTWLNRNNRVWAARTNATSPVQWETLTADCDNATTLDANGVAQPAPIRVLPRSQGGGMLLLTPRMATAPVGAPVMVLHRVRYEFKASTMVPGAVGLFRTMGVWEEEIAAPFAATARFRFYVNDALTADDPVPTILSDVTGLELVLDAVSERPAQDGTFPVMPYSTSVFFRNRL